MKKKTFLLEESISPDSSRRTVEGRSESQAHLRGALRTPSLLDGRVGSQGSGVLAQTAALVPQTGWKSPLCPPPTQRAS